MPKTATPRKPETVSRKLAETRAKSKNRSLSSLLGIGDNEKRLATDLGSGLNDVIGRGTIAGLLGLPGDLGGAAENGLRSLLGLPQVVPYGGSEHIGQKMEQAGLVSDVRRPKTELLASLISPAQAATAGYKAPQMARAGVQMMDNLASAPTMARIGQRGAVETNLGKMVAPQDEALRVAQANAAKPVSEGGLGLRPDNTPEERAAAMGFVNDAYHGTFDDIREFNAGVGNTKRTLGTPDGVVAVTSSNPNVASSYAIINGRKVDDFPGGSVYPLKARLGENIATDAGGRVFSSIHHPSSGEYGSVDDFARNAMDGGADSATIRNVFDPGSGHRSPYAANSDGFVGDTTFHFDPRNIRSRFAAFDPMRRDSSDLLAGLAPFGAVPWLRDEEP